MGGQGGRKRKQKSVVVVGETKDDETVDRRPLRNAAAKEPTSGLDLPLPVGNDGGGDESEADDDNPSSLPMVLDERTSTQINHELRAVSNSRTAKKPAEGAVLYIGRIPHGFYEEQMRGFFSQFGTVTRLRLARNRKTGRSKHYAFIEFAHTEVARIVAKAMDGYLMYSKILACKMVPAEDVHPLTFKYANKKLKQVDWTARERQRHNQEKQHNAAARHEKVLLSRERRKRRQLASLGIEYDFGGYSKALSERKKARPALALAPASSPAPTPASAAAAASAAARKVAGGKRKANAKHATATEAAADVNTSEAEAATRKGKATSKVAVGKRKAGVTHATATEAAADVNTSEAEAATRKGKATSKVAVGKRKAGTTHATATEGAAGVKVSSAKPPKRARTTKAASASAGAG
mmetsp:Transcript_75851/g.126466  ORF Transcript_75851/g.126466 Transcript_75851/m.126466 type:complete len:409 (-) Transcript_75851:449-1675(-)